MASSRRADRGSSCKICKDPLSPGDRHQVCVPCLGVDHAVQALSSDDFCAACNSFSRAALRARLREAEDDEAAAGDPARVAEAGEPAEHVFAIPLPRHEGGGHNAARAPASWSSADLVAGVDPRAGRSATRRAPPPAHTALRHEASQTLDDDHDGWPMALSDEDELSPPCVRSVCSSRRPGGDDDSASITSSSVRPDSVKAIFQRAADRLGLGLQPAAASVATPSSTAPEPMPGERPEPAVRPKPGKLPTVPGLQGNLHVTWAANGPKVPPRLGFDFDMAEWSELGLGKPPAIEPKLAKFLDGQFDPKAKNSPYRLVPGLPATFGDKATNKAVQATAAVYEKTSRVVSHLNASALLIGSLSHLLGELSVSGDTSSAHQEIARLTELLASLNKGAVQWAGSVLGTCVRQERDRWTDPVNLRTAVADVNAQLRDLQVSPDTLFPGGYEVVKAASDERKETAEMVSAVCDKEQPPVSTAPTPPKKEKRSASARGDRSPAPATTRPPPPPPVQQGGGGGGRGQTEYRSSRYRQQSRNARGHGKQHHK